MHFQLKHWVPAVPGYEFEIRTSAPKKCMQKSFCVWINPK